MTPMSSVDETTSPSSGESKRILQRMARRDWVLANAALTSAVRPAQTKESATNKRKRALFPATPSKQRKVECGPKYGNTPSETRLAHTVADSAVTQTEPQAPPLKPTSETTIGTAVEVETETAVSLTASEIDFPIELLLDADKVDAELHASPIAKYWSATAEPFQETEADFEFSNALLQFLSPRLEKSVVELAEVLSDTTASTLYDIPLELVLAANSVESFFGIHELDERDEPCMLMDPDTFFAV